MNKISEIERKVDLLVSGIVLPKRRTRRRVTAIVASVLIAMTLIASASLITTYYYEQTAAELDVKSAITIIHPDSSEHETPWQEDVTLVGTIQAGGETYIYPEEGYYTITNNADTSETVYIYIDVTEDPIPIPPEDEGEGLLVEFWDFTLNKVVTGNPPQIELGPGASFDFTVHITADKYIDGTSTYGYIITMKRNTA